MCSPQAAAQGIAAVANVAFGLEQNRVNLKNEQRNMEYRAQIALNNANNARNEALRQQQLGIVESRKEKLSGLRKANLEAAKNSANGFDMNSYTSSQNYQDIVDNANSNAQDIKSSYDLKADDYFSKANSYMNQIDEYKNDYNSKLYQNAMNSLNSVSKVAVNWYVNKGDEIEL